MGTAEWLIRLKGKRSDLEGLPLHFSSPECRVTEVSGEYSLYSSEFTQLRDASDVLAAGERIVRAIRALADVYRGSFPEIEAGGVARVEPDGRRTQFIIGVDGIPSAVRFGAGGAVTGGKPTAPQPDPLASKLLVRSVHPGVEKALTMFGSRPRKWEGLYKVFELVEEDVGGLMTRNGWVSEREIGRFTQTANHYRHSKAKHKLPRRPMSLQRAVVLIAQLLERWLDSK